MYIHIFIYTYIYIHIHIYTCPTACERCVRSPGYAEHFSLSCVAGLRRQQRAAKQRSVHVRGNTLPISGRRHVQNNTIQYNTIQYNTIQYNTIQYNTIQYNTIQPNGCVALRCIAFGSYQTPLRRATTQCETTKHAHKHEHTIARTQARTQARTHNSTHISTNAQCETQQGTHIRTNAGRTSTKRSGAMYSDSCRVFVEANCSTPTVTRDSETTTDTRQVTA